MQETIYEVVKIKQEIVNSDRPVIKVTGVEDVVDFIVSEIGFEDRKVCLALMLNTKLEVIATHRYSVGSLDSSIVHPREALKTAILNNACGVILCHQNTSGAMDVSKDDYLVYERMKEACYIVGIDLLDYLIVTHKSEYRSLREIGDLERRTILNK
ncbi:JAB domain-containing protein [Cytobacillus sp. FSL K6-0265]|uniref:JAB domain-containing protein n=1 Tax=Cytobacillus sp. FSL K6-0265 TaxID=2921448 RepID=UPI0030F5550D